jgi:hypothetical protein
MQVSPKGRGAGFGYASIGCRLGYLKKKKKKEHSQARCKEAPTGENVRNGQFLIPVFEIEVVQR